MTPLKQNLLEILSNHNVTFFIPPYQRNYEWTTEQCDVFLDDVEKTCEANLIGKVSEHFFGSITYFRTSTAFGQPDKLVLIDGQQRITTTMLFLAALRDIIDDKALATIIDSNYLKNNNAQGDSEYKIKLKQVETDWEAYRRIILREDQEVTDKRTAVYSNYTFFWNKLGQYRDRGHDVKALLEYGLNKFCVITIELQPDQNPWENPQEIFESMNSLGKPLSLSDLVRNYLLLGQDADTQRKLYEKYWLNIEKLLHGRVSGFIRDYMQAREKRSFYKATEANYKALYGAFKNIFAGMNTEELLKDLNESAKIYAWCIGNTKTGSEVIDACLGDLNRINVTTAYSFLMVFLKSWKEGKLTEQETVDILRAFRVYCLRRRLLGITQGENKSFPTFAGWIQDLVLAPDKKMRMFERLAKQESNLRLPNDIEISRHMASMNFANFGYSKFYLALMEESITKSRPNLADKRLQLEHIMPQTLNEEWQKTLGENYKAIHQEFVGNIGNLTLIRHNQELGNKPFVEKKKVYESDEGLQIARKNIINQSTWNEKAIRDRAEATIKYMLENVFPIPEEMRHINNFKLKENHGLSFQELQLIGLDIEFIDDPSFTAKVVDDKQVEFEGKKWKLSPLTREIQIRRGKVNKSGAYQGAQYWAYDGIRLADII